MIHTFIEDMRATSGNLAKVELLKTRPKWALEVFHYALNPFSNYGVKTVPDTAVLNLGENHIDHNTFTLLDKLDSGEFTCNTARNALHVHSMALTPNDSKVLNGIESLKLSTSKYVPPLSMGIPHHFKTI